MGRDDEKIESQNNASYLPLPPSFNSNDDWSVYEARLQQFFLVYEIKCVKRQAAILLTGISTDIFKTLQNLCFPKKPSEKTFSELSIILKSQFSPLISVFSERLKFYNAKQHSDESVNEWLSRLKSLAINCRFEAYLNSVLRDKFICGITKEPILARVCELEHDATFENSVQTALQREMALKEKFNHQPIEINKINKSGNSKSSNKGKSKSKSDANSVCYACGGINHDFKLCKMKKYTCKICNKKGHIAKVCKNSKSNNYISDDDEAGTESDNTETVDFEHLNMYSLVHINNLKDSEFHVELIINGKKIKFEVDTGSALSVCSEKFYQQVSQNLNLPLKKIKTVLKTYDGKLIKPLGSFDIEIVFNKNKYVVNILVIKNGGRPLIGRDILRLLKLDICSVNNIKVDRSDINELLLNFRDLFSNKLGCYKFGKVKIDLLENFVPKYFKPRPVPLAFQDVVKKQLQTYVDNGVLRKVDYSQWGTPLVPILKKDGSIRICADYKCTVNPFVKDYIFSLPLIEDIFAALNGGRLFSKLDMSSAYNQLELDEDSQLILAWSTQDGLFAPTRLPFGIKPACAIFQSIMSKTLQGCAGTVCFLDDILVTGKNKTEHFYNLESVFTKLREAGFVLRRDKCEFFEQKVKYLGYIIDADGLHKDPMKVQAIVDAPAPSTVTQVKAFVGLIGYYSRFFPNMAQILAPVYSLTKDGKFEWNEQCQAAFDLAKKIISSEKVLVHFDSKIPVKLVCDAALYGIGAAIFHIFNDKSERPIAFASRVLSKSEKNYSATDREALSVYFGVRRFSHYLLGRRFVIQTDHKALVTIFGTKKGIPAMAAGRLQRWSVYLSSFDFVIEHISGNNNVNADFLSRLPIKIADPPEKKVGASYLNFLAPQIDSIIDKKTIKVETSKDSVLAKVLNFVRFGWPDDANKFDELKPYVSKKNELIIEENVLMWAYRVIIPSKLRNRCLADLHATHSGMSKMKARARSLFWWPLMDKDIEDISNSCVQCLECSQNPPKVPISRWSLSSRPFQRVHMDFLGPFQNNMYMIILDSFSKWVEVFKMTKITTSKTIEKSRECFARFGLPEVIVSDNGTQFTSSEFQFFCKRNGIQHITSAPYKPQSNGAAENAVKTFKNGVKKAINDPANHGESTETLINRHLYYYRSSIHATTNETPFKLLFGREMSTHFEKIRPNLLSTLKEKLDSKISMEEDNKKNRGFSEGDKVIIREYIKNGTIWIRASIKKRIGVNMYLCESTDGKIKKRHIDQIKQGTTNTTPIIHTPSHMPSEASSDSVGTSVNSTTTVEDSTPVGETPNGNQNQDGNYVTRYGRVVKPVASWRK